MGEVRLEVECFCVGGLDSPNQIETLEEIRFYAQADFCLSGPGNRATNAKTVAVRGASGKSAIGLAAHKRHRLTRAKPSVCGGSGTTIKSNESPRYVSATGVILRDENRSSSVACRGFPTDFPLYDCRIARGGQ